MLLKSYFNQKKFDYLWKTYWWKHVCALVASINIYLLSIFNLIGFGIKYDGLIEILPLLYSMKGLIAFL